MSPMHFPRMWYSLVLAGFCTVVTSLGAASAETLPASPRETLNFNPGWKLFVGDPTNAAAPDFDDAAWRSVTLPHAWNEDSAFRVEIAELPTGIAWYRKSFVLPPEAAGNKVFLEFEGIRQGGEFYLNGKFIGRHENGVMAAGFDISTAALPAPQTNVLAVRTDNSWTYREQATHSPFQWNDHNFYANYGGIPKNVKLHIASKLYQTLPLYSQLGTEGVYVYAQNFDVPGHAATITVESQVRNEESVPRTFEFEVVLQDLNGRTVKTFAGGSTTLAAGQTGLAKASARVAGLNFWSWGYGYLYQVFSVLKVDGRVVDVVRTQTGFRETEFAHGYFSLNGRPLQLKGYAQRTSNEWPALGSAVPPWLSDFSNGLMVEDNANLVRWMHVTPWKQDVESCDRVGLIEAMPAGDAEGDPSGRRWEQRVEVMRDAIIYNRNNPSIIFYEGGNKGIREEHMQDLKAVRDRYDPHGGRAIGSREMLASPTVAEYGGEMLYINKSAGKPLWSMEYCRDEALRKYWDELSPPYHKDGDGPLYRNAPAKEYNRNQDSFTVEDVDRWYDYWRERPGTGTRVNAGGVNIIFSDSNTHCRGAENYRRSGEVDALRIPKDAFWAHQVMWDGWVDVEHPRISIVGHWNYAAGTHKPVYVVSSAEQVELFLNGHSLGKGKQSSRFLYTFENVAWAPGELRAVGLDKAGHSLCEATKETAGEPAALRLRPMTGPGGWRADGADVALVEVEVVDAQGRRCPTALNLVNFTLTGPAEWRGGLAQGTNNYILAQELPVECGVNRVLLRSTPTAGAVTLKATAAGLPTASLELTTQPVEVQAGCIKDFPQDHLTSSLQRGPTPGGPAFTVTRVAIPITKATAGAHAEQAALSFDDDESTGWSNDNHMETAWIEYEFASAATPAEVVVKLKGWRDHSYPLRITVDGHEVYRGTTPHNLGYATLPLKPVTGQHLKVELIGAASAQADFNITELENQKNSGGGTEKVGKGTLGIVEFECYEAAK